MYRSNRSFNMPPPPRAYPGHLTPLPSRGGGNLIIRVFQGVGNLIPHALEVGNLNCTLDFIRLAHKSSFWARSAIVSAKRERAKAVPGPTTPDQKTKRTTLRKSTISCKIFGVASYGGPGVRGFSWKRFCLCGQLVTRKGLKQGLWRIWSI